MGPTLPKNFHNQNQTPKKQTTRAKTSQITQTLNPSEFIDTTESRQQYQLFLVLLLRFGASNSYFGFCSLHCLWMLLLLFEKKPFFVFIQHLEHLFCFLLFFLVFGSCCCCCRHYVFPCFVCCPCSSCFGAFCGPREILSRPLVDTKTLQKPGSSEPYLPPNYFLCGPNSYGKGGSSLEQGGVWLLFPNSCTFAKTALLRNRPFILL